MLKWLMLLVLLLLNMYIFWRAAHCLKKLFPDKHLKGVFFVLILFLVLMVASLMLGSFLPFGSVRTVFHILSNYWLGFFLELVIFTLFADILVLLLKLINRRHPLPILREKKGILCIVSAVLVISLGLTVYGAIHTGQIQTKSYEISVEKSGGNIQDLNIVLLGDMHLGYSIGLKQMEKMVEAVNACNPDIIIMAGDAFDNEYEAISQDEEIISVLKTMKAKYGVYATWGNHDVTETLVGGFPITNGDGACRDPRMTEFLLNCGWTLLEDEAVLVDDSFYLIGRLDTERAGDGTKNRKTIEELTEGLDADKPWIVINHEPDENKETAAAGVDISLSGHTHAGQFFPLTIVQPFRWFNHWGYRKLDQLQTFTTSGIGVYGPPLRIATDSEIMQIQVHFA